MTYDELEAIVLGAEDGWPLQRAVAGLDEKARAKLSAPAQRLFTQLSRNKANDSASERLKTFIARRPGERWNHWQSRELRLAALALFAVGPLSAVSKRDVYVWHDAWPALDRILRDRRPEWLDQWIAHELEQEWQRFDFAVLRGWIRDGVCAKPAADGYYRMFASYLMRTRLPRSDEHVPPLSAQLLADPALLEDVEGLFRVEHNGFNTNSWLTKGAGAHYETWPDALVKLAAGGQLDRERLLCLALGGLRLDLKQNQLSGFHGVYKRMAPTADEQLRHQQAYADLLCHPVGHVVKFAIDMLAGVEKAGGLDSGPVVREIQVVLTSGTKGNASAALKLLKRIATRKKGADPAALAAVGEALRHADAEVQSQALAVLEAQAGGLGPAHGSALQDFESFVSASNRARFVALLAGLPGGPAGDGETGPAPQAAAARAAPPATAYEPISDDINDHAVLFAEDALSPIASLDELIDTLLHLVEVVDSPDDTERVIDAMSRLADDRPADFADRVAPLLHRVTTGRTGSNGLVAVYTGVGLPLRDLLLTWLTGTLYRTPDRETYSHNTPEDAFDPFKQHLRAIAERVVRGQPQALLSAPTHRGGWIDPLVWVERLRVADQRADFAQTMDFRLSLLRLAPDNRAAARERAAALAAPWRRVVLFALGDDELPAKADGRDHAAWITAARCRAPLADWSGEFAALELDDPWPDGLRPARYEWRASQETRSSKFHTWKVQEFTVAVACADPLTTAQPASGLARLVRAIVSPATTDWAALPSAAANRRMDTRNHWSGELNTTWVTQWLAYVWPQNPAGACMKGATKLAQRMDENSSNWTPGHGFLRVLFQRNRPWREPGHLLLCLGLVGKDADARSLAVDALIEGIDGRRFDPELFAATLAHLAEGQWVKLNRLADSLMSVIQLSGLHAAVVGRALQKCLPRLDLGAKSAFRLLEVLLEAQALTQAPLDEELRAALGRIEGSGKAAKLARALVKSGTANAA